ncbi:hypothetical protein LTR53_016622, partial [Teratosphaeriaceae sp. CCFEE 6253]
IFAAQGSGKDLEGIGGRRFEDSAQVSAARRGKAAGGAGNGVAARSAVPEPGTVSTQEWLSAEISSLKDTFSSLIEGEAPTEALRSFATNAIRLFHASTTSLSDGARRSPADASFLAISALVRISEQTNTTQHLLQAAYLAESLLHHDTNIHEARLILVYLYMRLGLGSLAMRLFDSLGVKELQHDTIAHALFTRLSLLHPHATSWGPGPDEGMLPLKRTAHALGVYARCEQKLAETEAGVLSHGQTGMLFDLQELRHSLRTSFSRRVTLLEQRRAARLTKGAAGDGAAAEAMGPLVCENWLQTRDNRDFSAAFAFAYNVEKALHGRDGGVPGQAWVLFALAADTAWCLATGSEVMVTDAQEVPNHVRQLEATAASSKAPASCHGLSPCEYLAGDLACCTLALLLYVQSAGRDLVESIVERQLAAAHKAVKSLAIDTLVGTSDPLAEHLLDHYAYADVLRIARATCRYVRTRLDVGVARESLQRLEDLVQRSFALLQTHATEQQVRVKASGVRGLMSLDEAMWDALQPFGGKALDGFCEEAARSAKEGWEGLLKISLV